MDTAVRAERPKYWAVYNVYPNKRNFQAYCGPLDIELAPHDIWGFLFECTDPLTTFLMPGLDHISLFLTKEGIPYSIILQPYKKSLEWALAVGAWNTFCHDWGLTWEKLPDGTSWHSPDSAYCIEFKRDPEVWGSHVARTFDELLKEREAAEARLFAREFNP